MLCACSRDCVTYGSGARSCVTCCGWWPCCCRVRCVRACVRMRAPLWRDLNHACRRGHSGAAQGGARIGTEGRGGAPTWQRELRASLQQCAARLRGHCVLDAVSGEVWQGAGGSALKAPQLLCSLRCCLGCRLLLRPPPAPTRARGASRLASAAGLCSSSGSRSCAAAGAGARLPCRLLSSPWRCGRPGGAGVRQHRCCAAAPTSRRAAAQSLRSGGAHGTTATAATRRRQRSQRHRCWHR